MTRSHPFAWRGWIVGCGLALSLFSQPRATDISLVVTQAPQRKGAAPIDCLPRALVNGEPYDQARIVVLSPTGEIRVLSEGFHSACDPDVSFDGERILFAGKKDETSGWRIWETRVDGQGLHPVSPESLDARMPIYCSTLFTLDSPEPWFTTVFVARERTFNDFGHAESSSLYNVRIDGTDLRRLTFNPNHDLDPFQMWDGRVIYAAERTPQTPGARVSSVGIHAIHMEGADMEFYGGEAGRRIQRMPCATEGGLVIFVEADAPSWDGAGQLGCLNESRPTSSYRRLTEPGQGIFLNPAPWHGNTVLVAQRPSKGEQTFGIVELDADTGKIRPVFDSADFHEVQVQPLRSRPRPDGHSTVVNPKSDTGVFYGLNAYSSDPTRQAHLKPGEIKRVRVIEGVLSAAAPSAASAVHWPFVGRRLVGEAPVEADGSFNVEAPADTPLLLQTVDERGLALDTSGWIWVKPKETRGCIGCHEDPELVPENDYVRALRRPSTQLTLAAAMRRTVTFREDIAPVLERHCLGAECHGGNETPLDLARVAGRSEEGWFSAYTNLLVASNHGKLRQPSSGKYVDAGRARTSWLGWQILGTNTARPWDPCAEGDQPRSKKISQMPPTGRGAPLRAETVRTLIQWIDMGAQYTVRPQPELPVSTQASPP